MKIHKHSLPAFFLCIMTVLPFAGTGAQSSLALSDLEPIRARINIQPDIRPLQFMESMSATADAEWERVPGLESWMIDTGEWEMDKHRLGSAAPDLEVLEEEPALESWMTAPAISIDRLLSRYITEDEEANISLEPWMLERKFWVTSSRCSGDPAGLSR